jgi:hypothetical protein
MMLGGSGGSVLVVVGLLLDGLLPPHAASTIPAVTTRIAARLVSFAIAGADNRGVVDCGVFIADRS